MQHKPMDANRNGYTIGYTRLGRKGPAVTNVESKRRRPEPGNDARSTNHNEQEQGR